MVRWESFLCVLARSPPLFPYNWDPDASRLVDLMGLETNICGSGPNSKKPSKQAPNWSNTGASL